MDIKFQYCIYYENYIKMYVILQKNINLLHEIKKILIWMFSIATFCEKIVLFRKNDAYVMFLVVLCEKWMHDESQCIAANSSITMYGSSLLTQMGHLKHFNYVPDPNCPHHAKVGAPHGSNSENGAMRQEVWNGLSVLGKESEGVSLLV